MNRTLIGLAALLVPALAHAGCEDHYAQWTQQLHPGRTLDTEHAACKVWPANEALTIAALPLPQKGNSEDQGSDDLEVLVADTKTGAIVAHRFQPAAITYDAMRFEKLELDTARYQLTPASRAFGVRVSHGGSSRVSPYDATALSLYVIDGGSLRVVLDRLVMSESTGDWDGNCAGSFDATTRTLDLGPAGKDGYAALKVTEKSVHTINTPTKDDCASKDQPAKRVSVTLGYRNGQYGVPKGMQYSD
ncbi:PA3715 family protein [Paraburkholderia acidisoli]|uniref:Multidrug ABC transporter ATPase n=1 Tax=Paraburkholderia acidisoli TaxID=2571748 RepID=A0A7Z2GHA5_9BURK|nr:hypothetical protein [Paraburkholderia acidisoli]QGZ61405.1 hypothetical protein FAZ98_06480 [Paraburkholderia acidisoli]